MKVNDVLRKGEVALRVLSMKDDLCLCINCNTKCMPTWMPANLLADCTPDAAPMIDTSMTARQKQIAHERFIMIAPMLAFLTDDKERKPVIQKHFKSFGGSLSDEELKKMLGISYGSLYKYKRELKEQVF